MFPFPHPGMVCPCCLRAWQIHNSNQPASELQIPMGIAAVTFLLPVLATPPWSLLIIELGAPLALAKKACKKMWMNMLWHGYAHFESIEQAAQMERSMGLSFLWPANNGWFVHEGEWRWMEHIWGVPWLRSKNAEQKPDFHGFPTSLSLLNTLHDILTDGPVWNPTHDCPAHEMHLWWKRCPLAPALASSFPSLPDRNQNRQRSTAVDRHGTRFTYRLQDGGNHRGTDAANQHKDHDVLSWNSTCLRSKWPKIYKNHFCLSLKFGSLIQYELFLSTYLSEYCEVSSFQAHIVLVTSWQNRLQGWHRLDGVMMSEDELHSDED